MKAFAVFPATRSWRVIDAPEPKPRAETDVLLQVLDVGVCGTDRELLTFEYGTPPPGEDHLILGHESLCQVAQNGAGLKAGDLVIPSVRRPCGDPNCPACNAGRQDFCYTGKYTERGIKERHGFMTSLIVENRAYLQPVSRQLREVAVIVEPLTIAEKAMAQLWQVQQRLPWACAERCKAVVLGAGPVGLLGAMKLVLEGFEVFVYSRLGRVTARRDITEAIGAHFVEAEKTTLEDMVKRIGNVDVVYEAVGASPVAFEMLGLLGTNGVFIFTGVPPSHQSIQLDSGSLMRHLVLRNQLVLGTVNASADAFAAAIADLGRFMERWPQAVRMMIARRYTIDNAAQPITSKSSDVKSVIAIKPD